MGESEGITFDLEKSELIHLTKRSKDTNSLISARLPNGRPCSVQPVEQGASLRWLGIHFDRKLAYKSHVKSLSAKALQVADGLRFLGNTVRGAPASLFRLAITACVLPTQYYSSEAWWPYRQQC